ncbi:hypothetical protein [Dickeya zeae]|nr:hypothetical protein [Dickeya zeae]
MSEPEAGDQHRPPQLHSQPAPAPATANKTQKPAQGGFVRRLADQSRSV